MTSLRIHDDAVGEMAIRDNGLAVGAINIHRVNAVAAQLQHEQTTGGAFAPGYRLRFRRDRFNHVVLLSELLSRSRNARGLMPDRSTDRALLANPKAVAQEPLQDLAATALRQLGFRELDVPWDLVVGEESPAVSDQIVGGEICSGLAHHARPHELTP